MKRVLYTLAMALLTFLPAQGQQNGSVDYEVISRATDTLVEKCGSFLVEQGIKIKSAEEGINLCIKECPECKKIYESFGESVKENAEKIFAYYRVNEDIRRKRRFLMCVRMTVAGESSNIWKKIDETLEELMGEKIRAVAEDLERYCGLRDIETEIVRKRIVRECLNRELVKEVCEELDREALDSLKKSEWYEELSKGADLIRGIERCEAEYGRDLPENIREKIKNFYEEFNPPIAVKGWAKETLRKLLMER